MNFYPSQTLIGRLLAVPTIVGLVLILVSVALYPEDRHSYQGSLVNTERGALRLYQGSATSIERGALDFKGGRS